MRLLAARTAVARYGRLMLADGLVVGTSGNLSVRDRDLIAVSPSGLPYAETTPELVGVYDLEGAAVEAPLAATTEMPMHLAVYQNTDARAVVHTHSTAATA